MITEKIDKIDVEDLIKDFRVMDIEAFSSYLKEVWRDLAQRSDERSKGVNKITFSKYYELPGIISDRLFAVLDRNKNDYIDVLEFIEGMTILFSENFDKLVKFIFDFYDFDKDGLISKEDVRVVLSYIPLNITKYGKYSKLKLKFEKEDFKDRVESQDELYELLEKCFDNNETLDQNKFSTVIENVSSDIFLFILIFLMDKKPFSNKTIEEFEGRKLNCASIRINRTPVLTSRLIASPNLNSKFSPSVTISKSPMMSKRISLNETEKKFGLISNNNNNHNLESKNFLMKFAGQNNEKDTKIQMKKFGIVNLNEKIKVEKESLNNDDDPGDENMSVKNIPVNRKKRNDLKNLEESKNTSNKQVTKNIYNDLPIIPGIKYQGIKSSDRIETIKHLGNLGVLKQDDTDSDEDESELRFEGHLYKVTQSKKIKKLWFKLVYRDLYYYKTKEEPSHKGMHNLSGVFLKEEESIEHEGKKLFCFSVIYPKKARNYYVENEEEYHNWIKFIQKATGYSSLTDIYDVKDKLGNGKFGLVRLGIHKKSSRKVAVKIMNKKDMTIQDLELVKTEIEILKVCQHPNIIRLYDVFENLDFIYIIMEHCSGGDLFSYIEKRGFRLSESRAAQLIHKLSTAIFYLHSYGIAHRDLKPENILMTDQSEEADIRLLDFGLSKIIGPSEVCNEPFGTLSYVAPEVLLEKPYDKSVDLWSIGIILYLLLCGCLPFDDENSEREIARQTINDPTPFPSSIWKKISIEAKTLVENLLKKDPNKRLTIKEVLEHPWIQKYHKTNLPEIRKKSKNTVGSIFKMYSTCDENSLTSKPYMNSSSNN